jgi:hypothetical protein
MSDASSPVLRERCFPRDFQARIGTSRGEQGFAGGPSVLRKLTVWSGQRRGFERAVESSQGCVRLLGGREGRTQECGSRVILARALSERKPSRFEERSRALGRLLVIDSGLGESSHMFLIRSLLLRRLGPLGVALTAYDLWRRVPERRRRQFYASGRLYGSQLVRRGRVLWAGRRRWRRAIP